MLALSFKEKHTKNMTSSHAPEKSRLAQLDDEVQEVLDVAKDNITKLQEREEKLDLLQERAVAINESVSI